MTCFCGGEGSDDVGRTSKDLLQFQSNFQSRHLNSLIWVPKQIVTKMLKDKGIIQFCDEKLTYFSSDSPIQDCVISSSAELH